jgi:hypothetical protein
MSGPKAPDRLTPYKIMAVLMFVLSFAVYAVFLDILIPGLPNSSARDAVDFILFLIPTFLLAGGQLTIGGFMIFSTLRTASRERYKVRMWQAMAVGGLLTFLFSLTYAAYPYYGPVYYAFFVGGRPEALLFEAVWMFLSITLAGWIIKRLSGAGWNHVLFAAGLSMLVIVVSAS